MNVLLGSAALLAAAIGVTHSWLVFLAIGVLIAAALL